MSFEASEKKSDSGKSDSPAQGEAVPKEDSKEELTEVAVMATVWLWETFARAKLLLVTILLAGR